MARVSRVGMQNKARQGPDIGVCMVGVELFKWGLFKLGGGGIPYSFSHSLHTCVVECLGIHG